MPTLSNNNKSLKKIPQARLTHGLSCVELCVKKFLTDKPQLTVIVVIGLFVLYSYLWLLSI